MKKNYDDCECRVMRDLRIRVHGCFTELSQHFPGGTEETHTETSLG